MESTEKPDHRPIIALDTHELAWAAGFFDGEGNVSLSHRKKTYPQIVFQIAQSDRRPLDRFAAAVGGGTVRGPYQHKNKAHRPYFVFAFQGFERVSAGISLLWPWLSEPKREQAKRALDGIRPYVLTRFIRGAGRAVLTIAQAEELRSEYDNLRKGRERIPRGARAALARKYGLSSVNTLASIAAGHGYQGRK